ASTDRLFTLGVLLSVLETAPICSTSKSVSLCFDITANLRPILATQPLHMPYFLSRLRTSRRRNLPGSLCPAGVSQPRSSYRLRVCCLQAESKIDTPI